jgi:hypothetical protein
MATQFRIREEEIGKAIEPRRPLKVIRGPVLDWPRRVSELPSFPGRHDDAVDALTQGLAWQRNACKPPPVQRTAWGTGG